MHNDMSNYKWYDIYDKKHWKYSNDIYDNITLEMSQQIQS